MKKRVISVFLMVLAVFAGVEIRTYGIANGKVRASYTPSSKSIEIASLKGTIYDCKLRALTNCEYEYTAVAKPTPEALRQLASMLSAELFSAAKERMEKGSPVAYKVDSSAVGSEDVRIVATPRRYSSQRLACHLIGYLDSAGDGISGIEKSYNDLLNKGRSEVRAYFSAAANGRMMLGYNINISTVGSSRTGVALTIDRDIQRITEQALDSSGAVKACAVVIEIGSGAIRAMVSRPSFDQYNIAAGLNDGNSPLINRALLPFSVGSVFKPVVAAAALESGITDFEYECTGSADYSGVTFNCHKKDGHGIQDLCAATANSCNTYFAALAQQVGAENIIKTAVRFGFGSETLLADGIKSKSGNLPAAAELDSRAAIANISFGQGALTATPVQICCMMAAIARGGVYFPAYLIEGEVDADGSLTETLRYTEKRQIISPATAEKLSQYLAEVVSNGSGRRAQRELVSAAGKTATAQTGRSGEDGEIYNAWFAGWFPAEKPKYAVVILKEDGGEGAVSCAPVFKEISEKITEQEK